MPSKVFFVPLPDGSSVDEQVKAMRRICDAINIGAIIDDKNLVAIKLSVGEKHNITHIKPPLVKEVID
ncbi:MAG: 4Fe-4S ferredoxin, partial [Bacillota bacterium]